MHSLCIEGDIALCRDGAKHYLINRITKGQNTSSSNLVGIYHSNEFVGFQKMKMIRFLAYSIYKIEIKKLEIVKGIVSICISMYIS